MSRDKSIALKYAIRGLFVGLIVATIVGIDLLIFTIPAEGIRAMGFLDWIGFSAPICLAMVGWYVGSQTAGYHAQCQKHLDTEKQRHRQIIGLYEKTINSDAAIETDEVALEDEVKRSLDQLQENIRESRHEEEKRAWITGGIAKFSELLRGDRHDLTALGDVLLSNLVKYLGANQAGLFLVNQDKQVLELLSCYAYERKKFLHKTIKFGQGLIGQTYLEGDKVWLKELPDDYLKITSGLGQATPRNLVLFPLKIEETVYGIVEIGSFHLFEPHHFELLDRIGELVASTIHGIQSNEKTHSLLMASQEQTEQLRAQEEEMRQNMEELAATQEDTVRKEQELQKVLEELKGNQIKQRITEMSITIESSLEGARKELFFIKSTPPVNGILRAKANGGMDAEDGSSEQVWKARLNVILENLLLTKQVYRRIAFVDQNNQLVSGMHYTDNATLELTNSNSIKDRHEVLRKWDRDSVYIASPNISAKNEFDVDMLLPVYYQARYAGFIALSLLGKPLIGEVKKREDEINKFALVDDRQNTLYTDQPIDHEKKSARLKETIILNEDEHTLIEVVHVLS
jgi:methyl-accepting chemotaxis protein